MRRLIVFIVITFSLYSCEDSGIINPSEKLDGVPILDVEISTEDYERMLNNRTNDLTVPARFNYEGSIMMGQIEASGAGSRYYPKWSYKAGVNDGLFLLELNKFNLSAQIYDPTMLYTTLVSSLYKEAGFETFKNKHLFLKINNSDEGLYPIIERIDEDFFMKRGLPVFQLFKLGFDSNFSFEEGSNYPEFIFEKKIPDDKNFYHLYELINARDTSNSEIIYETFGKFLDIDQYLRYHALTTLINNPDAFKNNFFLYKDDVSDKFQVIPWDFDSGFKTYNHTGLAGKNEIITKLFESDSAFAEYKHEVRKQLDTFYNPEFIFPIIDSTASVIKDAYNLDPYLGKGGRYNFDNEIEKLKNTIKERINFFDENLDGLSQDYFKSN